MSKTNESEAVTGNLKELGLPTMRRTFAAAAVAARANELTFEQYLLGLSEAELSHRRENRIGRLVRGPQRAAPGRPPGRRHPGAAIASRCVVPAR